MRLSVAALLAGIVCAPAWGADCRPNNFSDLIPVRGRGEGAEALLRSCRSGDAAGCERRIGMVLDTLDVVRFKAPVAQVVCAPENLTTAEARAALLAWADRHYPEARERWERCGIVEGPYMSGAFALMAALLEAYPCAERAS